MNFGSLIVVFVISWWMVLFIALPVGVKPEENPQGGNIKGAPKNPALGKKIIITTIISSVITALYFYLLLNGYFAFLNLKGH